MRAYSISRATKTTVDYPSKQHPPQCVLPMKSKWPKLNPIIVANHLIRQFTSKSCPMEPISTIHIKIKYFISNGESDRALILYNQELHPLGTQANSSILPSIIKASSSSSLSPQMGLQLHSMVVKSGSGFDPVISNALIAMYSKSTQPELAREVFDTMPQRDTVSWNSLINCYLRNGYPSKALNMLKGMIGCGFVPKPELIASVLSLCARAGDLRLGRMIHGLVVVDERIEDSVILLTSLVDFYFKCGGSMMALKMFNRLEAKNEVLWTATVSGCAANSDYEMAFECFRTMQVSRFRPNRVTLIAILPACAELGLIKHGKEVHGYALRNAFDSDHCLLASLIHMYSKCGEALHRVRLIFERSRVKDVIMWSSVIGSYSRGGDSVEAIKLFRQMREVDIEPNSITLLAAISACANMTSLEHGCALHAYIIKYGFELDVSVGNALIAMYSKCGCIIALHHVFRDMCIKDSITWCTLISSYGLHGNGREALCLFHEMQESKMEIDEITILAVLSACKHSGLVEEGRWIFNFVKNDGKLLLTTEHYACLIDLLGKSGKVDDAFDTFRSMPVKPDVKVFSSLVSACKTYGRLEVAQGLAQQLIMSEPWNAGNYTLLSMMFAESGNWAGVEEVRRVMRHLRLDKCYGFSQIIDGK